MAKVRVTADVDVPCGTPSLIRHYPASPEAVTAPRAHIDYIVAAGRGERVAPAKDLRQEGESA